MKIKEIIQNPNFMLNTEFLKYKILENKIEVTLELDPNKEVECIYYWYDHLTRGSSITNNIIIIFFLFPIIFSFSYYYTYIKSKKSK